MAAPLLRGLPLLRHRLHLHRRRLTLGSLSLRPWFTSVESIPPDDKTGPSTTTQTTTIPGLSARDSVANPRRSWDDPDYRKWKDKEAEILEDIEPVISLAKEIIHSNRYMDGERLTAEDEKTVIERLLAYHPHSEDKIGCGLDSIMALSCGFCTQEATSLRVSCALDSKYEFALCISKYGFFQCLFVTSLITSE
ncbi:uncharacterized protein [Coffea arabica]|uniref:Uncharacterized protein isoform X2 n=1 Tax=Coffea arabica TaxID=13443 RepID=A0ABM4W2A2_COFAR